MVAGVKMPGVGVFFLNFKLFQKAELMWSLWTLLVVMLLYTYSCMSIMLSICQLVMKGFLNYLNGQLYILLIISNSFATIGSNIRVYHSNLIKNWQFPLHCIRTTKVLFEEEKCILGQVRKELGKHRIDGTAQKQGLAVLETHTGTKIKNFKRNVQQSCFQFMNFVKLFYDQGLSARTSN